MLRYIVSHLRERALSPDCQYISATIFDGLNNPKEKKTSFGGRKRLRQKNHPVTRFDHTRHWFKRTRRTLKTRIICGSRRRPECGVSLHSGRITLRLERIYSLIMASVASAPVGSAAPSTGFPRANNIPCA